MQTLREIAHHAALSVGAEQRAVFNQLRGLQQRGHLRAARVVDGVQHYAFSEQVLARVIIAAVDAGVRGPDVALLEDALRNGRRLAEPLDDFGGINLEANLHRMRRGEDWVMEIGRHRYCGEKFSTAQWVRREAGGRLERFADRYAAPLLMPYAPPETRLIVEVCRIAAPMFGGAC